jgi:ABC-type multidrug transport system permease subunit
MNQHKFVLFFPVDISGNVIIVFSCAFLSGMVTIWIGAYLAPYFRKQVVIGYLIVTALGVLSMIFLGTFTKYSVMENFRYTAYVMGIFLMGWVLYNIQIDKAKENPID